MRNSYINLQITAVIREEPEVNGWTRDDKEKLFSDISYFTKEKHRHHLTERLIFDLSSCIVNKFTKEYTADQLKNKAQYEYFNAYEDLSAKCEQELSLSSKYSTNEDVPSVETLSGFWSDENSVFEFKRDGKFRLKFDNQNSIYEGEWKIVGDFLTITLKGMDAANYTIEEISKNRMRYRYINNGQKFNAERINEESFNDKLIIEQSLSSNKANFYDLIGKWKSDNCIYNLSSNGKILISWFSGGTTEGIWKLENEQLKVQYKGDSSWNIYNFILFTNTDIKYQHIKTNQVFSASKIR